MARQDSILLRPQTLRSKPPEGPKEERTIYAECSSLFTRGRCLCLDGKHLLSPTVLCLSSKAKQMSDKGRRKEVERSLEKESSGTGKSRSNQSTVSQSVPETLTRKGEGKIPQNKEKGLEAIRALFCLLTIQVRKEKPSISFSYTNKLARKYRSE